MSSPSLVIRNGDDEGTRVGGQIWLSGNSATWATLSPNLTEIHQIHIPYNLDINEELVLIPQTRGKVFALFAPNETSSCPSSMSYFRDDICWASQTDADTYILQTACDSWCAQPPVNDDAVGNITQGCGRVCSNTGPCINGMISEGWVNVSDVLTATTSDGETMMVWEQFMTPGYEMHSVMECSHSRLAYMFKDEGNTVFYPEITTSHECRSQCSQDYYCVGFDDVNGTCTLYHNTTLAPSMNQDLTIVLPTPATQSRLTVTTFSQGSSITIHESGPTNGASVGDLIWSDNTTTYQAMSSQLIGLTAIFTPRTLNSGESLQIQPSVAGTVYAVWVPDPTFDSSCSSAFSSAGWNDESPTINADTSDGFTAWVWSYALNSPATLSTPPACATQGIAYLFAEDALWLNSNLGVLFYQSKPVCGDTITFNEAYMACRALGYDGPVFSGNQWAEVTTGLPLSFSLGNLACNADSRDLSDCTWSTSMTSCAKSWAPNCREKEEFSIQSSYNVVLYGDWPVCDSGIGKAEADFVCRKMGYIHATSYLLQVSSGMQYQTNYYSLSELDCPFGATNLIDCTYKTREYEQCGDNEAWRVSCEAIPAIELSNPNTNHGIVLLGGIPILDTSISQNEADFVCRELNFMRATSFTTGLYNTGVHNWQSGDRALSNLACPVNATILTDCSYQTSTAFSFPNPNSWSVTCTGRAYPKCYRKINQTEFPTWAPVTSGPSKFPSPNSPTSQPTEPTRQPTVDLSPTISSPTFTPSVIPSESPSVSPSIKPTTPEPTSSIPSKGPSSSIPSKGPSLEPSPVPTYSTPTKQPSLFPSNTPSHTGHLIFPSTFPTWPEFSVAECVGDFSYEAYHIGTGVGQRCSNVAFLMHDLQYCHIQHSPGIGASTNYINNGPMFKGIDPHILWENVNIWMFDYILHFSQIVHCSTEYVNLLNAYPIFGHADALVPNGEMRVYDRAEVRKWTDAMSCSTDMTAQTVFDYCFCFHSVWDSVALTQLWSYIACLHSETLPQLKTICPTPTPSTQGGLTSTTSNISMTAIYTTEVLTTISSNEESKEIFNLSQNWFYIIVGATGLILCATLGLIWKYAFQSKQNELKPKQIEVQSISLDD